MCNSCRMNKKARWHYMGCFGKPLAFWGIELLESRSSWYDEFLRWKPSDHNNTYVISIDAWKIWQPSFALYNSARANGWFIYMNGVSGTYSMALCYFNFLIIIRCQQPFPMMAEYLLQGPSHFKWLASSISAITPMMCKNVRLCLPIGCKEMKTVLNLYHMCRYDASKLNLSEAIGTTRSGLNSLAKPAIRLSFDPLSENMKKHVSGWFILLKMICENFLLKGWEVLDSWQRLCYWGFKCWFETIFSFKDQMVIVSMKTQLHK